MATLLEAYLQILNFLLFLHHMEALLQGLLEVGGGISIHNTHVMNYYCPLLIEFLDDKLSLLFKIIWYQQWIVGLILSIYLGLHALHSTASVDEGVVSHM